MKELQILVVTMDLFLFIAQFLHCVYTSITPGLKLIYFSLESEFEGINSVSSFSEFFLRISGGKYEGCRFF